MQTYFTSPNVSKSSNSTPIRACGHVVGKVRGDTFYKSVDGSRHFLRIPPAICFDVLSLKEAERAGAVYVEVTDRETGKAYRVSIRFIWEHGFKVNRGFGDQIALPLGQWQIIGTPLQLVLI
jgi:hypothetical protein